MTQRVYLPGRKVAHLTDQGTVSYCRIWSPAGFWGTGSQEEYETAAALPLCKSCRKKNGGQEQ